MSRGEFFLAFMGALIAAGGVVGLLMTVQAAAR
jgi:hypothetical protein